jgi:hypothetical protein
MASSPDRSDPHRRYEVIEKAYCQGSWATVLEAGTLLLRELSEAEDQADVAGVRHRMHLLMAHTLLHGYGDRDAAEDLYELVRKSDAESSLRQIAEDGLDQCHLPLASTFVAESEEEEEDDISARPDLFLPETEKEEVVEQPTQAQKQAQPAQTVAFPTPMPQPAPSDVDPEPESEAGAILIARRARPEAEGSPDLGLAADPFQPSSGQGQLSVDAIVPVMPWLRPSEAAASEPPAEPEPLLASETSPVWERPPVLPSEPTANPEPRYGRHARSSDSQPLIPDVVEEPELMEVHQASPSLAEELELAITSAAHALIPAPIGALRGQADDLDKLRAFLVPVVVVG